MMLESPECLMGLHHTLRRGAYLSDKSDKTALLDCDASHRWKSCLGSIIALDGLNSEKVKTKKATDKIDSS